jgi:pilus assembly protein CpaF
VSEIIAVRGYDRTTKQFMYDTIFDLAGERDVPAIHPIISTSNKRENVHAIA